MSGKGILTLVAIVMIAAIMVIGAVAPAVMAEPVEKVPVCHKGEIKMVPPSAVKGHKGHGDDLADC